MKDKDLFEFFNLQSVLVGIFSLCIIQFISVIFLAKTLLGDLYLIIVLPIIIIGVFISIIYYSNRWANEYSMFIEKYKKGLKEEDEQKEDD